MAGRQNQSYVCALLACLLLLAVNAFAQQTGDFDDLARRASDAIDTNPAEAVALYGQALILRPYWAEGWLYRGAALFQLRRFSDARDSFRKGAALAPGKGTPLAFLGMADYELGDYQQALSEILQGEKIGLADKPAFIAEVRSRAAIIYLRSFDFPQALEQLRPLARNGIQSLEATEILGISVLTLHYLPSTLPAQQKELVDLAGRAAWAFLARHPQESAPLFQQLARQYPNQPGVHYINGVSLMQSDTEAAEQEFRTELRISPSHVLARIQLAQLLGKRGDTAGAIRLAKQAVALASSSALCHATLGRALLDTGQTAAAIVELQRAETLAPQAAPTHFYLLQAFRRIGRNADASREKAVWDRLRSEEAPAQLLLPTDAGHTSAQ
jgi:tetratricopeptide (TPR) repeat protein